jgi:hypothetical protein
MSLTAFARGVYDRSREARELTTETRAWLRVSDTTRRARRIAMHRIDARADRDRADRDRADRGRALAAEYRVVAAEARAHAAADHAAD